MIHLDRNQHMFEDHSLAEDQYLDWPEDHQVIPDFISDKATPAVTPIPTPDSTISFNGRITPLPQDGVFSTSNGTSSPKDGDHGSPVQDRTSSLSPLPETSGSPRTDNAFQSQNATSRGSTPLSELSPAPDDMDSGKADSSKNERERLGPSPVPKIERGDSAPTPKSFDIASPPSASSSHAGDSRVASVLELNMELLKVLIIFQSRNNTSDPVYAQYNRRLESNLTWLSVAANPHQAIPASNIPVMEPPPPVDFITMNRIHQLYNDLKAHFAKAIARKHLLQHGQMDSTPRLSPTSAGLKRDRSDEPMMDGTNKRRDTGETKMSSSMPPPPVPISPPHAQPQYPLSNGSAAHNSMNPNPYIPDVRPSTPSMPAGDAQRRQAQMRLSQPPNPSALSSSPTGINSVPNPNPSSSPMNQVPPQLAQQFASILQNDNHPFIQTMRKVLPNFDTLSQQDKITRMFLFHMRQRQQQQQQQQQQNQQLGMGNAGQMPNNIQTSPTMTNGTQFANPQSSPVQSSHIPQHLMGMTGGMGGQPAPPMQNMTPQQQQQFLLLAQSRGGNMNPRMMNPQQQQQMMMQQHQQQRAQGGGGLPQQPPGSPHVMSPMLPGQDSNFPALRSNPIPGIARSVRSPTEGSPSPLTPRVPSRAGGFPAGQDEYQRLMLQQQQQQLQQVRPMSQGGGPGGPSNFNPQASQMGMGAQNWQQQQQMQMQGGFGMQPGMGGGGGFAGGQQGQNWQQPGSYGFSSSNPQAEMSRHMSSTPGQHIQPQNPNPTDQGMGGDFDPLSFNWTS